MIRNLLLLCLLCLATLAQAQYSETFSVAGKGYKVSCVDDLTAVNWSLSPWSTVSCVAGDIRDPSDFFNTTAAGKLECIDLDQEVYWESPLINTTAANPVSIKMDLSWVEFDTDVAANNCSTDYIKVEYSVNGGAYVMIPNVSGGNACATIAYPFQDPGGQFSGSVSINQGGITGGSTLKIRIKVNTNANAELVTIDNVEVPEAGVTTGCAAPVLSTVITQVGCSNANSGAIDLTVSAGTPGYTYSWTGGATTQDLSAKPTGTYTVTVTDAASCSATISATITNAPTLALTTQVLDASCGGNTDGEISLDVSGGVPGYTYDWSNDNAENPDNDPQDLVNLGTGAYTVTVTDASGCTATTSATINVFPSGAYLEEFNTPNKGYLTNYVDDFAGVNWTLSGWAPQPPATFGRVATDFFKTSGGVLTATDLDQEICWESPLIDLGSSTMFSVLLAWTGMDNEDYINVSYSIDGAPYTQVPNVSGGGAGTIQYPFPSVDKSDGATVNQIGLSGSTIQILICSYSNTPDEIYTYDKISVPGSNPYCPAPVPTLTPTNVSCNGAANGSISNVVTDGSAPYTYIWSNFATTQNLSNIGPGTYTVTVTDANMSIGTASTQITEPTVVMLTETHVNVLCNGAATGSIDLSVSGGTGGYTYSWTGGATTQDISGKIAGTYTVTVTNNTTCTKTLSIVISQSAAITLTETHVNVLCDGGATGSIDLSVTDGISPYTYSWTGGATTQDRSGLAAGTYTVTVTDNNLCTKSLSVTITQPTAIVLTETHVNVLCNGGSTGSIDLSVNGGVSPYTYSWTGGATTQDISGKTVGTYTVTVTDNNLCTKSLSVTITEPTNLVPTETHVNVLCKGAATGSIDLSINGGISPYTYAWTGGATTQDRSGLVAGTYTVTVTDNNLCTKSLSVTITEPAEGIALTETHVNVLCNGAATGSIDLSVNGGISPYTYSWTGGATTQDRLGLAAGTYTVTVTDNNLCTKSLSVTIDQPTAIVLTETHVNVLCNGGSTGSIDLSLNGGVSPYTYSWTGGATSEDISGKTAGTYTVTVTDNNLCTKSLTVTITEPTNVVLTETHVNVLCNGAATGSIDLSVTGGVSPYTYSWTGGATAQDRSGLTVGTYTVTVTDNNLCTKSLSITITEPTAIVLTETHVNVLCNGNATGSIDLTVNGGVSPYSYSWTGGATTQDILGKTAGTYTVTVTDNNLCTKSLSVTITEPTTLVLTETHVNVLCNGFATGSIDLTVSGGVSPYSYAWMGGATTQDRSSLLAGTYTVTVTDFNACTKSLSVTITEPTAISLTATVVHPSNCFVADGSIDLSASGGVSGYTYDWSNDGPENPDNDPQDLLNMLEGTFTVTVTDVNACTATLSRTLDYIDIIKPVIICPANTTVSANASCGGTVGSYAPATLSDNCDANPSVVQTPVSSTTLSGHDDVKTITLTATDGSNNTQTCSFTVTLKDITKPTIICPANTTVNANASCSANVGAYSPTTLSDNCTALPTVAQSPAASTVLTGHNASSVITLTATDGAGNTQNCALTVTLKDVTQPTVSCKTFTANLNAVGTVSITTANVFLSGSDNCGVVNQVSVTPNTFNCNNIGANTVTLTVNDGNGNTNTCQTTVTVADVTPPTVVCKAFTTSLNASGMSSITTGNVFQSGADNCGVVNQQSVSPNNFTCANLGANTVVLTVNDSHGNTATCNATVTVVDVIAPTMLCNNATINLDAQGNATLSVGQINNGSFDNCAISELTLSKTLFTCANIGNNPVTLTGKDASNNTAQCSATVTVVDAILPLAKCKNASVNLGPAGTIILDPALVNNASSDNCSFTLSTTPASFNCDNIGMRSVTLRVTDAGGNTATCTAKVTIKDATPPNAKCKNPTIFLNDEGQGSVTLAQINNGSSDNCSVATLTMGSSTFLCSELTGGPWPVALTVKDGSNNTSTCIAYVTVKDNIKPEAVCQDVTVNLGPNGYAVVYSDELAENSYDNCTIWTYSPTAQVYTAAQLGSNNLTITVRDYSNNASSCVSVVTVLPYDPAQGDFQAGRGEKAELGLNEFFIYPNPTDGAVTTAFQLPEDQTFTLRIFDFSGRMIFSQTEQGYEGKNIMPLYLGELAPGIYLIDLQSDAVKLQKQLLIQR